jgi:hypothetical protein
MWFSFLQTIKSSPYTKLGYFTLKLDKAYIEQAQIQIHGGGSVRVYQTSNNCYMYIIIIIILADSKVVYLHVVSTLYVCTD